MANCASVMSFSTSYYLLFLLRINAFVAASDVTAFFPIIYCSY